MDDTGTRKPPSQYKASGNPPSVAPYTRKNTHVQTYRIDAGSVASATVFFLVSTPRFQALVCRPAHLFWSQRAVYRSIRHNPTLQARTHCANCIYG